MIVCCNVNKWGGISWLCLPFRLNIHFLTTHEITQVGQGPMDPLLTSISSCRSNVTAMLPHFFDDYACILACLASLPAPRQHELSLVLPITPLSLSHLCLQ